jgi:hypothetical protein
MRGADGGATTLTGVTLDGVSFTLDSSTMRQFNGYQAIECGYMLDADITSGTVTGTATRTTGTDGMVAVFTFFDDAKQGAPIVTLNGYASSPPDPVTTSVTTVETNSVLVDMIATSSGTAFTTTETGQTDRQNANVSNVDAHSSTRAVSSSGSNAMSWDTAGNTNRTTHIVLAIDEPAAGGSANPKGPFTHPLYGPFRGPIS